MATRFEIVEEQAHRIGLANRVFEDQELMIGRAPLAMGMAKHIIEDNKEGQRAFRERRKPKFKGR